MSTTKKYPKLALTTPWKLLFEGSDGTRRFWRGDNGGATYSVVAPTAVMALAAILAVEHQMGCTDDITSLAVEEIPAAKARTMPIHGDGADTMLANLPMFDVACSEWP